MVEALRLARTSR